MSITLASERHCFMTFIPSARAPESAFTTYRGTPAGPIRRWVPAWKPGSSVGWHGHYTDDWSNGNEREYPGEGKYRYVNQGGAKGNPAATSRVVRTDGADTPDILEDQQPHSMWMNENVFKKDTLQIRYGFGIQLDLQYIDDRLKQALATGQAEHDAARAARGESTAKELGPEDWSYRFGIQKVEQEWKDHYLAVRYDRPAGLLRLA